MKDNQSLIYLIIDLNRYWR